MHFDYFEDKDKDGGDNKQDEEDILEQVDPVTHSTSHVTKGTTVRVTKSPENEAPTTKTQTFGVTTTSAALEEDTSPPLSDLADLLRPMPDVETTTKEKDRATKSLVDDDAPSTKIQTRVITTTESSTYDTSEESPDTSTHRLSGLLKSTSEEETSTTTTKDKDDLSTPPHGSESTPHDEEETPDGWRFIDFQNGGECMMAQN